MKHICILLLFVSVSTFGQVTGRFNNILIPAGTTTITTDKVYNTNHDLYWNGEKISNWRTNGNSHIEPWPTSKKIYYPGMPSAAGQTLPSHYTPVYFNRYNNEFTTFLVNGGGGGQIIDTDTLTGCQGVYNYSADGQEVTIDIDSIYNICGCFYFLVTGENTTVTLQSIEGLLVGGTQTYTVTTGQNVLICPDSTEFLVSGETDPIYSADSRDITNRINQKRKLSDHDSLSKLDERSYESLTNKPVLSVTSDAPSSAVISSDSSDVILTAGPYNTLTVAGNEVTISTDTNKIATQNWVKSQKYELNVSADSENNWSLPFQLHTYTIIIYNGTPLRSTQWSIVTPTTLTVNLDVKRYDHIVLIN